MRWNRSNRASMMDQPRLGIVRYLLSFVFGTLEHFLVCQFETIKHAE